jgi:hypothetical protein
MIMKRVSRWLAGHKDRQGGRLARRQANNTVPPPVVVDEPLDNFLEEQEEHQTPGTSDADD